jgi:hypothetical protein
MKKVIFAICPLMTIASMYVVLYFYFGETTCSPEETKLMIGGFSIITVCYALASICIYKDTRK